MARQPKEQARAVAVRWRERSEVGGRKGARSSLAYAVAEVAPTTRLARDLQWLAGRAAPQLEQPCVLWYSLRAEAVPPAGASRPPRRATTRSESGGKLARASRSKVSHRLNGRKTGDETLCSRGQNRRPCLATGSRRPHRTAARPATRPHISRAHRTPTTAPQRRQPRPRAMSGFLSSLGLSSYRHGPGQAAERAGEAAPDVPEDEAHPVTPPAGAWRSHSCSSSPPRPQHTPLIIELCVHSIACTRQSSRAAAIHP